MCFGYPDFLFSNEQSRSDVKWTVCFPLCVQFSADKPVLLQRMIASLMFGGTCGVIVCARVCAVAKLQVVNRL